MKLKNIYLIILAFTSIFVVGCEDFKFGNDFLEKQPGGEMNKDSVFLNEIYTEQAITQLYRTLPDVMAREGRLNWSYVAVLTDLAESVKSGSTEYHKGGLNPATDVGYGSLSSFAFQLYYRNTSGNSNSGGESSAIYALRNGNIFVENVDRVPNMSEELKQRRKGEAKMLMAFHLVNTFRFVGSMPWIGKSYEPGDDMTMVRMTIAEHVEKTCALIDEAAALLEWSVDAVDNGRMTAAAGYALKSRLLTYAASPIYNSATPYLAGEAAEKYYTWYGDYSQERWQDAIDAGLEFIEHNNNNNNFYKLVDTGNPRADFKKAFFERYNKEVIIASHRWGKMSGIGGLRPFQQVGSGNLAPTMNYADMFEMKADGSDFDWDNPEHKANPFFTYTFDSSGKKIGYTEVRDPRLYETLWVNEDEGYYHGGTYRRVEAYRNGRESSVYEDPGVSWGRRGFGGVGPKKMFQTNALLEGTFYQCTLLRLPEIYLNIAEAMNEMGKATTKDKFGLDAYDYVNLVRDRVDMPPLTASKAAPGIELREAILNERAVEFGFEEMRYFDINRWMRKDWLEKPLRRLETTPIPNAKNPTSFSYKIIEGRYLSDRYWVENWSNRYYLGPLTSTAEINKGYGLVQNPGWE